MLNSTKWCVCFRKEHTLLQTYNTWPLSCVYHTFSVQRTLPVTIIQLFITDAYLQRHCTVVGVCMHFLSFFMFHEWQANSEARFSQRCQNHTKYSAQSTGYPSSEFKKQEITIIKKRSVRLWHGNLPSSYDKPALFAAWEVKQNYALF